MNLNEYAKVVHENAVKHGFWEQDQDIMAYFALVHSEWSEALEEYRVGRPMVWHECKFKIKQEQVQKPAICELLNCYYRENCGVARCTDFNPKPEGIAVELIDGVLRILDLAGRFDLSLDEAFREAGEANEMNDDIAERISNSTLPVIVGYLHTLTTGALDVLIHYLTFGYKVRKNAQEVEYAFASIIHAAFTGVSKEGCDPWAIMEEKHEFNKTRPYRHGGKKC